MSRAQIVRTLRGFLALCGCYATMITPAWAAPLPDSGPDTFGYEGTDIAANVRDVTGTGTQLVLSDDAFSGSIPLGFSFEYYGVNYTELRVSSNGLVDFDGSGGTVQFDPAGNGTTGNANYIGPYMTDLDPQQAGTIYYDTTGTPGSQEFVVGFYDVTQHDQGNASTFEVILHEASNEIEFQFGDLAADLSLEVWSSMEDALGTDGLTFWNGDTAGAVNFANTGYLIGVPAPITTTGTPEPSTAVLLAAGILGLGLIRRRRG